MDGARLNLSHGTRDDHARTRAARPRGGGGRGPADRADRRPPGAEAPRRRPRPATIELDERRLDRDRGRGRRAGRRHPRQPRGARLRAAARQRRSHRRRARPAPRRRRRAGPRAVRRRSSAASSRPTRASTCPASRCRSRPSRARTSTTSTRALEFGVDYVALSFVRSASDVKALRTLIEAQRLARVGDREDREGGGGRRARRDPRRGARRDGRPRRPRRRDRRRRGAAAAEADHRALARARESP